MAKPMIYTMRFFGGYRGRTKLINGHQFIQGEYQLVANPDSVAFVLKALASYGAYAKGTEEYDAALVVEEASDAAATAKAAEPIHTSGYVEILDGTDQTESPSEAGETDGIPSDVRPNGAEPTEASATDGESDVGSEDGGSGLHADRNGHSDSGLSKFEEGESRGPGEPEGEVDSSLVRAIRALDPLVDDHWVLRGRHAGKPKLGSVEEAFGKSGLTRADVENALPHYTREVASTDI